MTSPNTIIADLTAEVETLRKQRDELLASLEQAALHVRPTCDELYSELKEVITNAKCGS